MMEAPDMTPETVSVSGVVPDGDCFSVTVSSQDQKFIIKLRKIINTLVELHFATDGLLEP